MMFKKDMLIRAVRNGSKARILYIEELRNIVQIEYLSPKPRSYHGVFTYPYSEFKDYWEIDQPAIDKVISLAPEKSCSHKWKTYLGLRQTFEYCEICDLKKI